MTKKKVTAPLTYNPGKGRPKEHLAYLNYQEMQALKRLNGNNMERGPKGLPSFPPADARGSSSKASSTSRTSGPSSSLNAPARTAPSSASRPSSTTGSRGPSSSLNAPARTAPSSASRPSGSGFSGIGGGRDSGQAAARQTAARQATQSRFAESSRGTASVSRISGGTPGGNQRDAQFKAAAESRSISKAVQTPALKQDAGRSAIGGISKDKSAGLVDPSKIKGAIKGVQETAAEAALRRQGPIGPAPQQYKTIEDFNRAFAQELANKQFARTGYSPQELNRLAQGVYGEAAAEGYRGMNPAARSMINSIAGGIEVPSYSYLGGSDFDKLADRYTVFQDPNKPFKSAGIGSLNQTQGLFSLAQAASPESAFSKAADISDRIKNATHYYAQDIVKPNWADKSFERYGQHTFGTADAVSEKRIAAAREKIFGEPSYSTTGPVITPTSSTPERRATPGLIQYPRLDRPTPPTAAQEAARLRGLMESYQQPPGYGKEIVDRIAPEYRPYDIRIPPKDQRVITKPELSPRSAEEVSPFLKSFSERVPQEGTLEEGRLMGDLIAQDIFRKNNLAEIEAQSPSYGRLGAVDERMLYNPSEATTERMRQVFDRSRGMSYTPGLPAPMPSAPIPRPRPDVQGPPRPIRGMSFTGMPDQMFVGAEVPYRPYDISRQKYVDNSHLLEGGFPSINVNRGYPGDMRDIGTPERLANPTFVPTPSPGEVKRPIGGMSFTPNLDRMTYPKGFIPVDKTPTPEMVGMMRPAGPFVTTEDDPESLRYKEATKVMGLLPGGYPEITVGVEDVSESMPEGETSPNPSQGMNEEQEARVDETLDRVKKGQQGVSVAGGVTGIPIGLVTRPLTKKYMENVKERLDKYAAMTREEKLAAEKKDPSLIGWGRVAGIPSESDYSVYTAWAEKSGLRAPPSREGGGSSGIASLGGGSTGGGQTGIPTTPDTPSTPSGRRPDIYYMWDLGVNIPSPSDPNYTQYQRYLAERLAAQRAMGYA